MLDEALSRFTLQPGNRVQVGLAPFAVLLGHAIGIVHGAVGFVFADDPPGVVAGHEPFGDLVEVELAGAHLGPGLGAVAGEVLVVDVVHQVLPLVERGDDVHAASDDVAYVGGPAGDFGVEAAEDDVVVFLGADEGGGRGVGVVGADEAGIVRALGDGVDVFGDVEAALLQILGAAGGQSHGAEHGAGEVLQVVDGEVGGFTLIGGFGFAVPGADEGQAAELHVVLLQGVLHLDGIDLRPKPVLGAAEGALGDLQHHRFDAGEACF